MCDISCMQPCSSWTALCMQAAQGRRLSSCHPADSGCMQALGSDAQDQAAPKQGLRAWLKQMPALQQSLQSLLPSSAAPLGQPQTPSQCCLPQLRFPYAARQPELKGCLLSREWLWLTAAWLPPDQVCMVVWLRMPMIVKAVMRLAAMHEAQLSGLCFAC